MSEILTQNAVEVYLRAYCHKCKTFHDIKTSPGTPLVKEMESWEYKHRGHEIEFVSPKRRVPAGLDDKLFQETNQTPWFLDYKENTDFKLAFVSAVNMTFTSLNSLASDTNLLAGASALAVDNGSTGVPLEIGVSGYIKNSGTTPTASREIDVYGYAALDDVPTYPDTLDGTDATKTITTTAILDSGLVLVKSMLIAATASQVNPFSPVALSSLFGVMPRYWSIFVVHNSGQSINASGNKVAYKGVYVQG